MTVDPKRLAELPERVWYGSGHPLALALAPLGWIYCALAGWRAHYWRWHWRRMPSQRQGGQVPVIVVGNLTVGGTGKTPLVLWLAEHLRARGWRPGILTRGYGGRDLSHSRLAPPEGDPATYGDEPLLLARHSGCPVMAGRNRPHGASRLIADHGCDILLADDGLQHYRLRRDLEILLIDGERGFGNRRCLPAGPLREPVSRADKADLCLTNGGPESGDHHRMVLNPRRAINLADPRQTRALAQFVGQPVTAVAGIGHPEQFFRLLEHQGLKIIRRAYPDHHPFTSDDCRDWPAGPVLMTEKDAVKCRDFATKRYWYLPVSAEPDDNFVQALHVWLTPLESARRRPEEPD